MIDDYIQVNFREQAMEVTQIRSQSAEMPQPDPFNNLEIVQKETEEVDRLAPAHDTWMRIKERDHSLRLKQKSFSGEAPGTTYD